jgi:hypothetical protein
VEKVVKDAIEALSEFISLLLSQIGIIVLSFAIALLIRSEIRMELILLTKA